MCGGEQVCSALLKAGANPEVTNTNGDTPLLVACLNNNFGVAKRLLDVNANATVANKDGVTPLLAAMNHDNMEMFQALIAAKADTNRPDKVHPGCVVVWRREPIVVADLNVDICVIVGRQYVHPYRGRQG